MPVSAALETFGKYRLLSQIGEGGMGIVYRAEMDGPNGSVPVVVKRVRPELSRDPSLLRMMAQEARLGVLMRHPCLVSVIETGEVVFQNARELYLVLEYVDGYDLAQILDRTIRIGKQVPLGVACWLAQQAAEALDYAHTLVDERNKPLVIAHRDISPSNLMITRDGAVKLLDFGIAKASDLVQDERTRTGMLKGKFTYFSPEQAEGLPLDARSDLFSLGVVLMELLLQRRLFRGNGDFDTLRRVREAVVPRPSRIRSEIDAELEGILLRLLQRRREDRYPSAKALLEALGPVAQRHGAGAQSTRAFLASIQPIERRASAGPHSELSELPEAGETTGSASMSEIIPTEITRASPARSETRKRSLAGAAPEPAPWAAEPHSRIGVVVDDLVRPAGVPRWKAYLLRLPDGVRSYPECTIKAAVVLNLRTYFGNPPVSKDAPQELHDFIASPPLVSSYVSGVVGRLFVLGIADELGLDDDEFIARAYMANAQLLASPLYRMLFTVLSTDRLIRNAKSRWAAFHHGIELVVPEHRTDHAHAILRSPPFFEPSLVLRMHAAGLRAALEAVGAENVRTKLEIKSTREAHVDVSWDA